MIWFFVHVLIWGFGTFDYKMRLWWKARWVCPIIEFGVAHIIIMVPFTPLSLLSLSLFMDHTSTYMLSFYGPQFHLSLSIFQQSPFFFKKENYGKRKKKKKKGGGGGVGRWCRFCQGIQLCVFGVHGTSFNSTSIAILIQDLDLELRPWIPIPTQPNSKQPNTPLGLLLWHILNFIMEY